MENKSNDAEAILPESIGDPFDTIPKICVEIQEYVRTLVEKADSVSQRIVVGTVSIIRDKILPFLKKAGILLSETMFLATLNSLSTEIVCQIPKLDNFSGARWEPFGFQNPELIHNISIIYFIVTALITAPIWKIYFEEPVMKQFGKLTEKIVGPSPAFEASNPLSQKPINPKIFGYNGTMP